MTPQEPIRDSMTGQGCQTIRALIGERPDLERDVPPAIAALASDPPQVRSALIQHLARFASKRIMCDSEHGIDGLLVTTGGAEIWNAAEYSPWHLRAAATLIMGDCLIAWDRSERRQGVLEVLAGATLYVAGDLFVGTLLVSGGEVHCAGTITVAERLDVTDGGYCFSTGRA
jgi:hypothetical protein